MAKSAKRPRALSSSSDSDSVGSSKSLSTSGSAASAVAALICLGSSETGFGTRESRKRSRKTARKTKELLSSSKKSSIKRTRKMSISDDSSTDENESSDDEDGYVSHTSGSRGNKSTKKRVKMESKSRRKATNTAKDTPTRNSTPQKLFPPTPKKNLFSLGGLAIKFLRIIARDGSSNLNSAAEELQVVKRRMYDVVNILEGTRLLIKEDRHHVVLGLEGACFIRNEVAEGERYIMQCWETLLAKQAQLAASFSESNPNAARYAQLSGEAMRERSKAVAASLEPMPSSSALLKATTDIALGRELQRRKEQDDAKQEEAGNSSISQATVEREKASGTVENVQEEGSEILKGRGGKEEIESTTETGVKTMENGGTVADEKGIENKLNYADHVQTELYPNEPWRRENIRISMLMQIEARLDAHIRNAEARLNSLASQHPYSYVTYSDLSPVVQDLGPNPTIAIHASPDSNVQLFKGRKLNDTTPNIAKGDENGPSATTANQSETSLAIPTNTKPSLKEQMRDPSTMLSAFPLPEEMDVLGFSWTARERAPSKKELESTNNEGFNCLYVKSTCSQPVQVFAIQSTNSASHTEQSQPGNDQPVNNHAALHTMPGMHRYSHLTGQQSSRKLPVPLFLASDPLATASSSRATAGEASDPPSTPTAASYREPTTRTAASHREPTTPTAASHRELTTPTAVSHREPTTPTTTSHQEPTSTTSHQEPTSTTSHQEPTSTTSHQEPTSTTSYQEPTSTASHIEPKAHAGTGTTSTELVPTPPN